MYSYCVIKKKPRSYVRAKYVTAKTYVLKKNKQSKTIKVQKLIAKTSRIKNLFKIAY